MKKIMLVCLMAAGLAFSQTLVETLGKSPLSWKSVADKVQTKEQVTEFINASKQILPTLTDEEVKAIALEINKTEFFRIARVINMPGRHWALIFIEANSKTEVEHVWKTDVITKSTGHISHDSSKN